MLIKVKAFPSAGKKEIIKKSEDSFEVWVKEKPIKGQANRAVASALAEYFSVSREDVKMLSGFQRRNKVFKIKV
ncbi:MAG: DUF167 domain-containing protein [Candidatus Portnoybacteria bacterium]|nr:DUF167 domain-containing protein [Candidatus Portnoybacteria bacterium]